MYFAKEMLVIEAELQKLGHEIFMPIDTHAAIEDPGINMDPLHCDKFDVTMDHFKKIEKSDAVFVLNYSKNGLDGYVGGSSLMEIGLAYYLKKKIFILHPLPSAEQLRYVMEIVHMKPIIID